LRFGIHERPLDQAMEQPGGRQREKQADRNHQQGDLGIGGHSGHREQTGDDHHQQVVSQINAVGHPPAGGDRLSDPQLRQWLVPASEGDQSDPEQARHEQVLIEVPFKVRGLSPAIEHGVNGAQSQQAAGAPARPPVSVIDAAINQNPGREHQPVTVEEEALRFDAQRAERMPGRQGQQSDDSRRREEPPGRQREDHSGHQIELLFVTQRPGIGHQVNGVFGAGQLMQPGFGSGDVADPAHDRKRA